MSGANAIKMNKNETIDNMYFDFTQQNAEDSISSYLSNVFSTTNDIYPSTSSAPFSSLADFRTVKLEPTNGFIKKECNKSLDKNVLGEIRQRIANVPAKSCTNDCLSILPALSESIQQYCDITEFLTLPQNQAAKKLSIPPSTLSKRWKEASRNRKWPWRVVRKIDKEISCLLHNIPTNGSIPEEVEAHLSVLLKKRQEELRPVVIRI